MALLEVKDLAVSFVTRNGVNKAVDGISFTVESSNAPKMVGVSGCTNIRCPVIRIGWSPSWNESIC